jgi:hypothetical protein
LSLRGDVPLSGSHISSTWVDAQFHSLDQREKPLPARGKSHEFLAPDDIVRKYIADAITVNLLDLCEFLPLSIMPKRPGWF